MRQIKIPFFQKTGKKMNSRQQKKLRALLFFTPSVILLALCILFAFQGFSLRNEIEEQKKEIVELESENKLLAEGLDQLAAQSGQEESRQPEATVPQTPSVSPEEPKKVYLTFDDGPSVNTGKILDILNQNNVKATFFVIGKTDEASKQLYKRIVAEGHSIGIHSYSHRYSEIYRSIEALSQDIFSLQSLIKETTGKETYLYRFPGGSSNQVSKLNMKEAIAFVKEKGFFYHDWNAYNGDATNKPITVEEMVNNVLKELPKYDTVTVLMHDGSGKDLTVESLPILIQKLKEAGVEILPIDETTTPVQHVK